LAVEAMVVEAVSQEAVAVAAPFSVSGLVASQVEASDEAVVEEVVCFRTSHSRQE
jgi:hypothetical protein